MYSLIEFLINQLLLYDRSVAVAAVTRLQEAPVDPAAAVAVQLPARQVAAAAAPATAVVLVQVVAAAPQALLAREEVSINNNNNNSKDFKCLFLEKLKDTGKSLQ